MLIRFATALRVLLRAIAFGIRAEDSTIGDLANYRFSDWLNR